jgi:hypothetical protein
VLVDIVELNIFSFKIQQPKKWLLKFSPIPIQHQASSHRAVFAQTLDKDIVAFDASGGSDLRHGGEVMMN